MSSRIYRMLSGSVPELALKLRQAGINKKPEDFIKTTFMSSFYLTFGVMFFLFGIFSKKFPAYYFLIAFALVFFMMFFYLLRIPEAKIMKVNKAISKEIVYASRFILIELESGITMYKALKNASKTYDVIGKYLQDITDKVDMGISMEDAINQSIELVPSWDYRRVMWQILNTLQTGADVSKSLNAVINQIVREQVIEVDRYGKKLNPIAMFYMIVAVILPSLGITMLIVMASFIGLDLKMIFLLALVFFLAFVQFMFVAIIKSSRPPVEL